MCFRPSRRRRRTHRCVPGISDRTRPHSLSEIQLRKHLGTARWAYNWGLQRKLSCHKESRPAPNWMGLSRELNASKATAYPWLYDVSKSIPIEALKDLDRGFVAFFRRGKSRKSPVGFPKFKRKRDDRGSCRFRGIIRLSSRHIQLPRVGLIERQPTMKQEPDSPENGQTSCHSLFGSSG